MYILSIEHSLFSYQNKYFLFILAMLYDKIFLNNCIYVMYFWNEMKKVFVWIISKKNKKKLKKQWISFIYQNQTWIFVEGSKPN